MINNLNILFPALSFSCEFKKTLVVEQKCTQTIRLPRKNPFEEGDYLYIYWKQRCPKKYKNHHKLGEGIITKIYNIKMGEDIDNFIQGDILKKESIEEIVKKDGFDSFENFKEWFKEKYDLKTFKKFKIIRWKWV